MTEGLVSADHRSRYRRDADAILQTKAYARYFDKTQVVYLVHNDHVAHRGLHVQLVSSLSRGLAQALNLDVDLVEAIALGHDVGHPPFGHEGENYLSELTQEHGFGPFAHPVQSCRLLHVMEPLDMVLEVYDGILCHDGGMQSASHTPSPNKTWQDHHRELAAKQANPELDIAPMTLEGCLVKVCDTASYIGRDLEDGISLGLVSRSDVPDTILGNSNSEILRVFCRDLIQQSQGKGKIALSDAVFEALRSLRQFNFERIYHHPNLKVESRRLRRSYRMLFEFLLQNHERHAEDSYIWRDYLATKDEAYTSNTSPVQMVVDYISGMTDGFFLRTLKKVVVPGIIDWN